MLLDILLSKGIFYWIRGIILIKVQLIEIRCEQRD